MLRPSSGEAAQDLLGLGGAQTQGGRVLHQLVVLLGDQVPVDCPGLSIGQASPSPGLGRYSLAWPMFFRSMVPQRRSSSSLSAWSVGGSACFSIVGTVIHGSPRRLLIFTLRLARPLVVKPAPTSGLAGRNQALASGGGLAW